MLEFQVQMSLPTVMEKLSVNEAPKKLKNEKVNSSFNLISWKGINISIYKPLIPLKIALIIWFSASYSMVTYLTLLFKQRGLTLSEIAFIYMITSVAQLVCNTACGVFLDKVGRPVLLSVVTTLIAGSLALCLAFSPPVDEDIIGHEVQTDLYCGITNSTIPGANHMCENAYATEICFNICSEIHEDLKCCEHKLLHQIFQSLKNGTSSDSDFVNDFDWCLDDQKVVLIASDKKFLCNEYHRKTCVVSCVEKTVTNHKRTMYVLLYTVVVVFFLTFTENVFRFFDIVIVSLSMSHEKEYGKQQIWSVIGLMVGPSLSALAIQMATYSDEKPNYAASLYLYASMCILTIFSICSLNVAKREPAKNMWKGSLTLLKDIDFLFFAVLMLIMGGTWGFHLNFKNVYMEELGTPIYMIGLLDTFSALCGLPALFTAKWLTSKIGDTNVFVLALLGYTVKCLGYSYLRVAWPAFFLEMIPALSFHLLWVAAMNFCAEISPEELKGSVVIFAGTLHYSVGVAIGSLVGGLLMSAYGGSRAFQIIAAVDLITAVLYSIYLLFRQSRNKKVLVLSK
ncbi:MFS_1_like domain-containing protein [Caerostris darwini]|uniref:MFS_1_like domain-containing protein n=1 Tax=Caerostris darwini TaxID=1538125 RepID=A0AAV4QAT6_9ARAC|nr:MFS_1_like domain-containing protein [Caerostris darwini]